MQPVLRINPAPPPELPWLQAWHDLQLTTSMQTDSGWLRAYSALRAGAAVGPETCDAEGVGES